MKRNLGALVAGIWVMATVALCAQSSDRLLMVQKPKLPKGTTVLTLQDCLHRVLAEDPAVLSLRFDVEVLDRRARAVRDSYLPQLVATGQAGFVSGQSTSYFSVLNVTDPTVLSNRSDIPGLTGYRSGGGQLSLPLINEGSFFGINTPPAATALQKTKEATEFANQLTTQQILYQVTTTYLSIIASKNKLQILDRQRKLSKKQLDLTQAQFKYNLTTQKDVDAAVKVAEENELAYEASSALSVESFVQLGMMLGIDTPSSFSIQTDYPPMPKLPSYPMMMAMIQDHQPSVLQQEALVGQAKAQLAVDQNRIWPTVNFQGNYAYADGFEKPDASLWTTFFTVNVPVFDSGVLHQTTRSDLANVKASELRVAAARDSLFQNLYTAYSAIRDITYTAATINSEVALAQKTFQKTEVLQNMQAITLAQAIVNEQSYLSARLEQEDVTLRDILSYAQLQEAVGGRWNWLGDYSQTGGRAFGENNVSHSGGTAMDPDQSSSSYSKPASSTSGQ